MNKDSFAPSRTAFRAANQVSGANSDRDSEIDIFRLLSTLWRGKWWLVLAMLCALAACMAYLTWVAVPRYTASTVIAMHNRSEQIVDFETVVSGLSGDQASVNTEVEVLKARSLIERLVEQLDLESDPEYNKHLRPLNPWSLGGVRKAIESGLLGLDSVEPVPAPRKIRDDTIDEVLKSLAISNIRLSYVFRIEAESEDPQKAALLADTLADLYVQSQLDLKFEITDRATVWLAEKVAELEIELETAENAVKEFLRSTDMVSPETLTQRNRQLKDFRDRLTDTLAQNGAFDQRVSVLDQARSTGDPAGMVQVAYDDALRAAYERLAAGGTVARAAFEARFDALLSEARFQLQRTNDQIATLNASIRDLERQVTEQSAELLRLEQLEREASASRQIYEYFLTRLKQTSVQRGVQQADSRLLSRAVVPDKPSAPSKLMLLALSLGIGLVVSSSFVLLREARNSAFRSSEDLEDTTGIGVIGDIPRASNIRRRRVLRYLTQKPTSAMSEAVRNLRTSLLLSDVDKPPQVIMLASSVPGEGKTTLSLALAHNLSGMKRKVLLIEGDIRRRVFREYFGIGREEAPTLMTAMSSTQPLPKSVYRDEELGADILFGEEAAVNAADFFSSKEFGAFMHRARETYDFVVIDTPPVLLVPDARVIGQSADAILYVVHWEQTPRGQVLRGLRSFANVNLPVTGLVLSQVDTRRASEYQGEAYASSYYSS